MLKVGVLGAGHLGKIHLRLLQQSEHYELVGFYDENADYAEKIAAEFGYKRFDTIAKLIHAVDVIDIVTPTLSHYKCAKVAIKSGKHVFIEKPIATTVEEAEETAFSSFLCPPAKATASFASSSSMRRCEERWRRMRRAITTDATAACRARWATKRFSPSVTRFSKKSPSDTKREVRSRSATRSHATQVENAEMGKHIHATLAAPERAAPHKPVTNSATTSNSNPSTPNATFGTVGMNGAACATSA